jgi:hypothetical protein
MKKLFWVPAAGVLLFLGFAGFFVASIIAVIGMVLNIVAEGLGSVFDWYQVKLLKLLKYTGDRVFNEMD